MKAFVAGATGQTGRRITTQLIARGIPVRALVRDRQKAETILPAEVELVVGDVLKPQALQDAMADSSVLVCATGAAPSFNPLGPFQADYIGTKNLVDAAVACHLKQFVLVSSLCTSKLFHPLNLFWLILLWKKQAEQYLQKSELAYTIVRPGGLKNEDNDDNIVMAAADHLFEGSIPRTKVAEVCIESLLNTTAQNKIVEIVAQSTAPNRPLPELFASII